MSEGGEQDAVHGCPVLEGSHGPCPSPDFAEASFDCIGGSYLAALILRFVAKAGEQFVEAVTQAGYRCWILVVEAVSKPSCSGPRGRGVGRIHDPVERAFDRWLIGLFDLVENVADLVGPAARHRDAGKDCGQSRQ